jgi:hypothetical protein
MSAIAVIFCSPFSLLYDSMLRNVIDHVKNSALALKFVYTL